MSLFEAVSALDTVEMFALFRVDRISRARKYLSARNFSHPHHAALLDNAHVISKMFVDNWARKRVRRRGINWNVWKAFCQPLSAGFEADPVSVLDEIGGPGQLVFYLERVLRGDKKAEEKLQSFLFHNLLFPLFERNQDEVIDHARNSPVVDLRMPHEWFPAARAMERKIIFHCGATNTGKTYHALKRLAEAAPSRGGGLYCGPLRLLALEAFEKLNSAGAATNLRTGQEIREVLDASHISSTIEMVNLDKQYDVVVIDEIQMIADKVRGDNWTRTLLGAQASEIHLCGGQEALPVVQALLTSTQEALQVIRYERQTPLEIELESLKGDYSRVQPGDCIVAFSKKDIFSIRREIEDKTKHKCAVIYGQLPPETRSMQARLFNEENTGYDVLVASDAIGMGLNLNVGRIIFHTTVKTMQDESGELVQEYVTPSQIKQIAGRAGRLSSNYSVGKVTAWQEVDLAYVRAVMDFDVPPMQTAGIFPSEDQVQEFSDYLEEMSQGKPDQRGDESAVDMGSYARSVDAAGAVLPSSTNALAAQEDVQLVRVLKLFLELSQMDKSFHLCYGSEMLKIAKLLDGVPLTIRERYMLAHAPVGKSEEELEALLTYCTHYAARRPVPLDVDVPTRAPRGFPHFEAICKLYSTLDLYLWLQVRYPEYFTEKELCLEKKDLVLQHIDQYLQRRQHGGDQEYTHLITYRKTREKMSGKLPAAEHRHILESTLQHLDSVKDHELVITRKEKPADSSRSSSNRGRGRGRDRRGGRGGGRREGRGRAGGRCEDRFDSGKEEDGEREKRSYGKKAKNSRRH